MQTLARVGGTSLYGSILGVGSVFGSLNNVLLNQYLTGPPTYKIREADLPFGTIVPPRVFVTTGASIDYVGVYINSHTTACNRYRALNSFQVGSYGTIKAATLILTLTGTINAPVIRIYQNPSCSSPPVVGDWGNVATGTFIKSFTAADGTLYIALDPALITQGAFNYFGMGSEADLTDVSPGSTSQVTIGPQLVLAW